MKRWWGIRHVRYFFWSWRARAWAISWGRMGIGLGYLNESDEKVLKAIWRGER